MNIIHLVVGNATAQPLLTANELGDGLEGEVVVLKDILHVGPLKTGGSNFSEGRGHFWAAVRGENAKPAEVDDLERLMAISSRLSNDESLAIWFWMAPTPADVCAYFWLLHFLKKHQGRFSVININGLPFLDEQGKLFYPESIGHLPVKGVIKAKKLARATTQSEWETDADEWPRLLAENGGIRVFKGGKKLESHPISFYDETLLGLCSGSWQKTSKIISTAIGKNKIPTGDTFLQWRLREMAGAGLLELNKADVRLAGSNAQGSYAESGPISPGNEAIGNL
ncbi:MAG: DUF3658 domain-containing protein [Edaphocola sp.]